VKEKSNWVLTVIVLLALVISRKPGLMPLNFSLIYGLAFCAGTFPRTLPWSLVLATTLTTDIGLNLFYYRTEIFSDYMAVNYLAYGAIYFLGRQFKGTTSLIKLTGGGIFGAVVFYIITNTAAWVWNPVYAKTVAGWIQALTTGESGWPETWKFFRNTLLSGGLFTGMMSAALRQMEPAEPEPAEEEETEEAAEPESSDEKA
jgi:hypothetical protein